VQINDGKVPQYAVFYSPALLPTFQVQIFSSAPCSQTSSICDVPLMRRIKFYTHPTGKIIVLHILIFTLLDSRQRDIAF
jgi:hypothetical protein